MELFAQSPFAAAAAAVLIAVVAAVVGRRWLAGRHGAADAAHVGGGVFTRDNRPIGGGRPTSFIADANAALRAASTCCRDAASHEGASAGLAVYATRRIAAGEAVLVERPFALTVSMKARERTCAHCLKDARVHGGRAGVWSTCCKACKAHFYCSESCAAAAAAYHSGVECDALALLSPLMSGDAIDPEDAELISQAIRVLALRAKGVVADVGPAGALGAGAYHPHSPLSRMIGIPSKADASISMRTIASIVLKVLPPEARIPSEELVDLLERHGNNEFGVSGRGGEVVACGSFIGFFHILNHSCRPNVVFDSAGRAAALASGAPPLFSLVALDDIEAGEELCHSYENDPGALLEHYGFVCACPLCEENRAAIAAGLPPGKGGPLAREWQAKQRAIACPARDCGAGDGVRILGGGGRLRCVHCAHEWDPSSMRPSKANSGRPSRAPRGRRRDHDGGGYRRLGDTPRIDICCGAPCAPSRILLDALTRMIVNRNR